jgi:DNA gyrase/topoisomerase IV subunit B
METDLREKSSEGYKVIMNEFTRYDPTLPHIHNIKCPNGECPSNTGGGSVAGAGGATDADEYRITGGTNGCGAKILTTFSTVTIVECQDNTNYFQVKITTDANGNKIISTPIIKPKANDEQFTCVTFSINWADSLYKKYTPEVNKLFCEWLMTRCASLSLFLNQYRKCNVKFNKKEFSLTYNDIPKSAIHSMVVDMKIKDKNKLGYNKHIFGDCKIYISVLESGTPLQLSFINGIEITTNPILNRILTRLFKSIKGEVASTTKFELTKNVFNIGLVVISIPLINDNCNGVPLSNTDI